MKNLMNQKDTPMRSNEPLEINSAQSWRRLQRSKSFFEDLDQECKEQYRCFMEALMVYNRQDYLRAQPYERSSQRRDQANGFYRRWQTSSFGCMELRVP